MPHMVWPPKVQRIDMIGEVQDINKRKTPRDIGRPVHLGGNTYYTFGDTFCFDDRGEFVGGTNNTIAFVPNPQKEPQKCQYLEQKPWVSQYIPHTPKEHAWENEKEHKEKNDRVTCWPFSGIVETENGKGWAFFDKALTHGGTGGHHFGIGVARVHVGEGNHVKVDRPMGEDMVFGEKEPRFGSITHFQDNDGWVYLYGGHDPNPPWDMRVLVCRIKVDADFTKRQNYEFWVKGGGGHWAPDYGNDVENLHKLGELDIQAQGAVIKCPGLAPEGKPYMWFGVNKFMASHMYVGCAPRPEGPWDIKDAGEIPQDPAGHTGPRYALYPHNKSCHPANGCMLVSWSDGGQMGGKVNMAKYHFEKQDGSPPEPQEHYELVRPLGSDGGHGGGGGGHHGGMKEELKRGIKGLFG